ncbi:MAG: hypothetical protein CTY12_00715 [Methylotenera sp.]|nr:MAG: hypothetical protein CTY12_00715 [Methylotenera sp.]
MPNPTQTIKSLPFSQQQELLISLLSQLVAAADHDPRAKEIVTNTLIFVRDSMVTQVKQSAIIPTAH